MAKQAQYNAADHISPATAADPYLRPAFTASDVARIRGGLSMTQATFASLLAVSRRTVEKWEQGTRTPTSGTARLLQFIEHPDILDRFLLKPTAVEASTSRARNLR